MVYKKFLTKDGKKYGPYLYENKRVGQKIVTNYLGKSADDNSQNGSKKNKLLAGLYVLLIIVGILLLLDVFLQVSPTGWVLLNLQPTYVQGEPLKGLVDLNFNGGELIPKDAQLYVSLGGEKKVFNLTDLIDKQIILGDFYAADTSISGEGYGYGLTGKRIFYPTLNFDMLVSNSGNAQDLTNNQTTQTTSNSTTPNANFDSSNSSADVSSGSNLPLNPSTPDSSGSNLPTSPDSSGTLPSTGQVTSDGSSATNAAGDSGVASSSSSSSSSADSGSPSSSGLGITGNAISESEFTIKASVSKDNPYDYTLADGQSASFVENSVKYNGTTLPDNNVVFGVNGNKVHATTDYSIEESGFGKEFLTSEIMNVPIDMSKFGLIADNGTLEVKLVYQDNVITSSQKRINAVPPKNNETLNETLIDLTQLNASISLLKNIPLIRIKSGENTSINLSEYFKNAESFGFNVDNISSVIENNILTLIPDNGFKGARKGTVLAYGENQVTQSNEFTILVSSGAINITTSRSEIKLGEAVKWTANVSLEKADNISIELPCLLFY